MRGMTYCLGIVTKNGLVMASDSRTNAGYDQINTCRKMHTICVPGERVFVILTSGSLSCSQSVLTLLKEEFDAGEGLATVATMYEAARIVGEKVRAVSEEDREALEKDEYKFNVHLLLGGQIKGQEHALYLIYPQGNPLRATEDAPYLQTGEVKYGRPILDRGIRYDQTTLEEAAKYALLSLDSTMKSNVTVGPPIDLMAYSKDEMNVTRHRRFQADDPALAKIRLRWDQALRQAVMRLPDIRFKTSLISGKPLNPAEESIQLVENASPENLSEIQAQAGSKPST
jgi:putative proteasome-type protease